MLKTSYNYDQYSARLTIEGVPDLSLGQTSSTIGILTSWKLQIVGFPQLEGKLEHLQCLISVVLPYSRFCLTGFNGIVGDQSRPVSISSLSGKHELALRSSQEGVSPISLELDDGELADLIKCLDMLKADDRVMLDFQECQSVASEFLPTKHKFSWLKKIFIPSLALITIGSFGTVFLQLERTRIKEQLNKLESYSLEESNKKRDLR